MTAVSLGLICPRSASIALQCIGVMAESILSFRSFCTGMSSNCLSIALSGPCEQQATPLSEIWRCAATSICWTLVVACFVGEKAPKPELRRLFGTSSFSSGRDQIFVGDDDSAVVELLFSEVLVKVSMEEFDPVRELDDVVEQVSTLEETGRRTCGRRALAFDAALGARLFNRLVGP